MNMKFFLPMVPPTITAQEHKVSIRNGRPVFYDPPELVQAKVKLLSHLLKYQPDAPLTGPLRLVTQWCFPVRGKHHDGEPKATKPDTDNLQKALKDCMTKAGFWKDDAQVTSEIVEKFYANIPGIYIQVSEL